MLRAFCCKHCFCSACLQKVEDFCPVCNSYVLHSHLVIGNFDQLRKDTDVRFQFNGDIFDSQLQLYQRCQELMNQEMLMTKMQKLALTQSLKIVSQPSFSQIESSLLQFGQTKFKDTVKFHAILIHYALTNEIMDELYSLRSVSTIQQINYQLFSTQLVEILRKSQLHSLQVDNQTLALDFDFLTNLPVTLQNLILIEFQVKDRFLLSEIGTKFAAQLRELKVKDVDQFVLLKARAQFGVKQWQKYNFETLNCQNLSILQNYNLNCLKSYQIQFDLKQITESEFMNKQLFNANCTFSYFQQITEYDPPSQPSCKVIEVSKVNFAQQVKNFNHKYMLAALPFQQKFELDITNFIVKHKNMLYGTTPEVVLSLDRLQLRALQLGLQTGIFSISCKLEPSVLIPPADPDLFQETLKLILVLKQLNIKLPLLFDLILPNNVQQFAQQCGPRLIECKPQFQAIKQYGETWRQFGDLSKIESVFLLSNRAFLGKNLPPRTQIYGLKMLFGQDPDVNPLLFCLDYDEILLLQKYKQQYFQYKLNSNQCEDENTLKRFLQFEQFNAFKGEYCINCDYFTNINFGSFQDIKTGQQEILQVTPSYQDWDNLAEILKKMKTTKIGVFSFPCATEYVEKNSSKLQEFFQAVSQLEKLETDSPFLALINAFVQNKEDQLSPRSCSWKLFCDFLEYCEPIDVEKLYFPVGINVEFDQNSVNYYLNEGLAQKKSIFDYYQIQQQLLTQMDLFKEKFPAVQQIQILNSQLLLLNVLQGAVYVAHLYKLFNQLGFDTLFFKNMHQRFVKFNSFCVGGLNLVKSIQFGFALMTELAVLYSKKEIIFNNEIQDEDINSKRKSRVEKDLAKIFDNFSKQKIPGPASFCILDHSDEDLDKENLFQQLIQHSIDVFNQYGLVHVELPKFTFKSPNFIYLVQFFNKNAVCKISGSILNQPSCLFVSSVLNCINGTGQKIVNIGCVSYQQTTKIVETFQDDLLTKVLQLSFQQLNQQNLLCQSGVLDLFSKFKVVKQICIAENALGVEFKHQIEQFIDGFPQLEEVCFGEEFDIQAKCQVSKGRLELFGGLVVRRFKFEDPEVNQNVEEERLWMQ